VILRETDQSHSSKGIDATARSFRVESPTGQVCLIIGLATLLEFFR
jgi:hypothetical protein